MPVRGGQVVPLGELLVRVTQVEGERTQLPPQVGKEHQAQPQG